LYLGIEIIVMPKFDLAKFCEITERKRVTYGAVVPPVVLQLGKSPIVDKYNMSSLRMISSGAAPLTKELVALVRKRLNIPVVQGYGLSETSPVTHQQVKSPFNREMPQADCRTIQSWESDGNPVGSIGTLLASQTSKFVSPTGDELPDGSLGELWVKGPNVFKGYLNNVAGTKNALTTDGWFKTGDVGYQDVQGNVFITDRSKELIKYNAFQVAPAELEGVLMSHPKISDVAVVGVRDDERATEVPRAYVVTVTGVEQSEVTSLEILRWMRTKIADHKQLRGGVRYIQAIPKTASGKILRSALREQANKEGIRRQQAKI
jgi:4-coumarate--CoA ligase